MEVAAATSATDPPAGRQVAAPYGSVRQLCCTAPSCPVLYSCLKIRPGAALLGALRIRRLRFKTVSGLVSLNWGQNGAWCRKWRFATNVAHCDKYGAVISGVLTYITLPSLVRIAQHLSKLWSFEVFNPSWHVPRGRWRRLMGTCL